VKREVSAPPALPGFTIERLLGSGGFADVFLYQQELPRRLVAVKVLVLENLTDQTRAAFVAEANLMAQLSAHPYIVTIHHAGVAPDGRPYLVMEYCSGPSLAEQYKRGAFSVSDALRTGVRLASAVATAHAAGILHRDIKPANVLTNDYGWPALTDFGISSAIDDDLDHTTTVARVEAEAATSTESQPVGMSIPWSPAEMFADDPRPDVRSDVFSLAATVHTLLAGRSPFEVVGERNGAIELIDRIERGTITPIGRPDLPRSLVAVLSKAMAVRKEDRFASAIDFARALQRVELELGYAQTNLDVPHLVITADAAPRPSDDAETRIRSVATISPDALPAAPASAPEPAAPQPADPDATVARPYILPTPAAPEARDEDEDRDERTVLRAMAQPTVASPPPTGPPAPPEPRSRRPAIIGIAAAALALVIVAVVVVSIVVAGGNVVDDDPLPTPTATGGGGPAIVENAVPTPEGPVVAKSGDVVTFTFVNPAPEDGDSYQYARSENPTAVFAIPEPVVSIAGIADGQSTCVDTYVVRSGKRSAPLTICYP
jgi:serine/threonine protein kinase